MAGPWKELLQQYLLPCSAILLVGVSLYAHTMAVPFYLDDLSSIVNNHVIHDFPSALMQVFTPRGLTQLTFALNLRLSGLSLFALHLTNIGIHILCGCLVYLLLRRLNHDRWLPLFGALLFVAHPLQTQAVTYLVQRATSLGALFFLLAVLCFIKSRDAMAQRGERSALRQRAYYFAALTAGAAAVFCKESTATLPLVLIAYDRLFLPRERLSQRSIWLAYFPFLLVPALIGGMRLWTMSASAFRTHAPLVTLSGSSPETYLATQFSVIWEYFRLLLLPWGQALEHDYPLTETIASAHFLLALAGLVALSVLVWSMRRKRPLLVFGVAWFFAALVVESSLIPLDPLVEHRLYLPMVGVVIVIIDGLTAIMSHRLSTIVLLVLVTACAPLTWKRNQLWSDQVAFYEDNLRLHPGSERAREFLVNHYQDAGHYPRAQKLLDEGLKITPGSFILKKVLALLQASQGRSQEAILMLLELSQTVSEESDEYAVIVNDLVEIYLVDHQEQKAISLLQILIDGHSANRSVYLNKLATIMMSNGETAHAKQLLSASLDSSPRPADAEEAHLALSRIYYKEARWTDALSELQTAWQIMPGNPKTLEGICASALQQKNLAIARWALDKLRHIDTATWSRLNSVYQAHAFNR